MIGTGQPKFSHVLRLLVTVNLERFEGTWQATPLVFAVSTLSLAFSLRIEDMSWSCDGSRVNNERRGMIRHE